MYDYILNENTRFPWGIENRNNLDINVPRFLINNNIEAEYIKWYIGRNNKTIVKLRCKCGEIFDAPIRDFQMYGGPSERYNNFGFECRKCRSQKNNSKRFKQVVNKMKQQVINMGYIVLDEPIKSTYAEYFIIENNIGQVVKVNGDSFIRNNGSVNWIGYRSAKEYLAHNLEIYLKEKYDISPKILKVGKNKEPVKLECECGNKYTACDLDSLKRGRSLRCPECSKKESSYETSIKNFLKENNIRFTQQKSFDNCKDSLPLPFDFYLKDYNIVIEVQGKQHYEPSSLFDKQDDSFEKRQLHDQIKSDYCLNTNNPKLITLSYNCIEDKTYKLVLSKILNI